MSSAEFRSGGAEPHVVRIHSAAAQSGYMATLSLEPVKLEIVTCRCVRDHDGDRLSVREFEGGQNVVPAERLRVQETHSARRDVARVGCHGGSAGRIENRIFAGGQ